MDTSTNTPPALNPKRLRWWIFSCIAFVVIAPLVSTIIGLKTHAPPLSFDGTKRTEFPGRIVCIQTYIWQGLELNVCLDIIRSHPHRGRSENWDHDLGLDNPWRTEIALLKG